MQEATEIQHVIRTNCTRCGGNLSFSPEKQDIVCLHCGYEEQLNAGSDQVVENILTNSIIEADKIDISQGNKIYKCGGCGASTVVDDSKITVNCPFCGSQSISVDASEKRYIKPAGMVTFKISKAQVGDVFNTWIGKGFFHPGNLRKLADLDILRGVYIPFWTYDADTQSHWSGDAGFYYTVTETTTDSSGKEQTVEIQKTRWESRSGTYLHSFDDVLISGSKGLPQEKIDRIYPYELNQAINFEPKALYGWEAEIYDVDVQQGYQAAHGIMDKVISQGCSKSLGGDTQRFLSINTVTSNQTFKLLMLPVYIANYMYSGKSYNFVVNGQTGAISGKKPVSAIRVIMVILLVLALVFLGYYLYNQQHLQ